MGRVEICITTCKILAFVHMILFDIQIKQEVDIETVKIISEHSVLCYANAWNCIMHPAEVVYRCNF